jgi:hypothetical protein
MGKFFYLPPNAKIVKWTKNSNAKSKNLTLESTKSQWQTPPWLVEWLGSPPWLSSLAKCTNRTPKTAHGPFKTRGLLKKLRWASFSHRPASFCRVFPKTREFFSKTRQKIVKNSPEFFPKNSFFRKTCKTREFLPSFTTLIQTMYSDVLWF